jgi:hypothetical protein
MAITRIWTRGELPSPPFSYLSPSLPLPPLFPCACPLFSPLRARVPVRRHGTPPRHSPFPSGAGATPPLPSPAALGPSPSLPVRHGPSPPRRRSAPPLPFPVRRGPSSPLSGGARPAPAPRPPGASLRGRGSAPAWPRRAASGPGDAAPAPARGLDPRCAAFDPQIS